MTEEKLPEEVTKHSFRQKTWDYLMKNELVNFPVSAHNRIPNFKGAEKAAQRLAELNEFKKATVININPDKPQEPIRFLALEANKEILVPVLKLKSGLFHHVTPVAGATKEELKTLSKPHCLQEMGKPIGLDSDIKVDLIVVGSVCVSPKGYRVGKGKGFGDLEYAMMMRMGAITHDVTVITTVHDCQVVESLPPEIFEEYDVPVDIIVTPTRTIIVDPKLMRPTGIIWHMLSDNRIKTMQVLKQLKEMDEKDGKVVTTKKVNSDTETQRHGNRSTHTKNKRRLKSKKEVSNVDGSIAEEEKEKVTKPRFPRKRTHKKSKSEGDNNASPAEGEIVEEKVENTDKNVRQTRKNLRHKVKQPIEFSLKLSNISSSARVRDLKNALLERGVKPSEITWQGYRGICYLHFSKLRSESSPPEQPIQVDSIMANLQELRIGKCVCNKDDVIIVQPAKPISRIEVTDVTSV